MQTFLVDLDVSSLNNVIRSRNPGGRRNLKPSEADDAPTPIKSTASAQHAQDGNIPEDATPEGDAALHPTTPSQAENSTKGSAVSKEIQILEFDSRNPIVSYGDQVYSCTWTDVIGTNLYFSEPSDHPKDSRLSAPGQFDFLGSSRIKLVGHRARVTQKSGTRKRGRPANEDREAEEADGPEEDALESGKSLGDLRFSSAKVNAEIRRQARFLENFMNVKKARGDRDVVRTIVNPQMVAAMNRARTQPQPNRTDQATLNEEVERLNRRIIRGDVNAVARLQQIYSLDDVNIDELPKLPEGLSVSVPEARSPSDHHGAGG